jgi:hypothetical protein
VPRLPLPLLLPPREPDDWSDCEEDEEPLMPSLERPEEPLMPEDWLAPRDDDELDEPRFELEPDCDEALMPESSLEPEFDERSELDDRSDVDERSELEELEDEPFAEALSPPWPERSCELPRPELVLPEAPRPSLRLLLSPLLLDDESPVLPLRLLEAP